MTDTQVTWLTQESHDRLKAELDQLIANRPVIAAEINDRREEGDLRENGGYHAAREEQGQQEARIRQLQDLLNNAKVGEGSIIAAGTVIPENTVVEPFSLWMGVPGKFRKKTDDEKTQQMILQYAKNYLDYTKQYLSEM